MHIGHATTSNPSPSTTTTTTMRRLILCGLLALLSGIIQASSAHSASSNDSGSLNERSHHQHEDIFNPALAAAFKVGLANVASSSSNTRSSNKRANAFGKQQHSTEKRHKKKSKRTPQVLSDLLGDDADVLEENGGVGAVVVLLEGGTVTSGSVSTVRVVPTTYTTTLQGKRSECRSSLSLIYSSLSFITLHSCCFYFIPRLA